jgi:hypothetical protein
LGQGLRGAARGDFAKGMWMQVFKYERLLEWLRVGGLAGWPDRLEKMQRSAKHAS